MHCNCYAYFYLPITEIKSKFLQKKDNFIFLRLDKVYAFHLDITSKIKHCKVLFWNTSCFQFSQAGLY